VRVGSENNKALVRRYYEQVLTGRDRGLLAIDEAVRIRRELAAARPDAFRLDLASSLNNMSNALAALGRREDAPSTRRSPSTASWPPPVRARSAPTWPARLST
jgi:hypothetical protein